MSSVELHSSYTGANSSTSALANNEIRETSVAENTQLAHIAAIADQTIISRKVRLTDETRQYEILIKRQKIMAYRDIGAEYTYIDETLSQADAQHARAFMVNASACTLDDTYVIDRLSPQEKSELSANADGITLSDLFSAKYDMPEVTAVPVEVEVEETRPVVIAQRTEPKAELVETAAPETVETANAELSGGYSPIEEFFETLKDKTKFAYFQKPDGSGLKTFGDFSLEDHLPDSMFASLEEWNELVSASLKDAPKLVTSAGPTKHDSIMVTAVGHAQGVFAEVSANKFGVVFALWNAAMKKV